jgi:Fe-S oxidoreductase
MLDTAERWLREILAALRPSIERGVPVVGLEPSCIAVFRDELTNLFPNNQDAIRLKRLAFTLGEFLEKEQFQPPKLDRKALVHGHCQHKAIMKLTGEEAILKKMGLDFHVLDSGCCGMAGAFGYEAGDHYDVSLQCGERVLLPAVRHAAKDTLIIADGFSCREQIAQGTDRRALHLAQVIQMAIREDGSGVAREYPERLSSQDGQQELTGARSSLKAAALIAGGALAAGGLAYLAARRARNGS